MKGATSAFSHGDKQLDCTSLHISAHQITLQTLHQINFVRCMPIFVNIHDERTSLDATVATNKKYMPDALSHDRS